MSARLPASLALHCLEVVKLPLGQPVVDSVGQRETGSRAHRQVLAHAAPVRQPHVRVVVETLICMAFLGHRRKHTRRLKCYRLRTSKIRTYASAKRATNIRQTQRPPKSLKFLHSFV